MKDIEKALGIEFSNDKLLEEALTHSSFSTVNYERLEFLGDSVLGLIIADAFFTNTPFDQCELTRAKSSLVKAETLAKWFNKLKLEEFVVLGKSMANVKISESIRCDFMEAIIGAIYVEKGLEVTKKFIFKHFDIPKFYGSAPTDSKTKLQEWLQKNGNVSIRYKTVEETRKGFVVESVISGKTVAHGEAQTKKEAEQIAARKTLTRLKKQKRS